MVVSGWGIDIALWSRAIYTNRVYIFHLQMSNKTGEDMLSSPVYYQICQVESINFC
tara:strand:+ start:583 stop:750 length:168 start_codon:yes stop_codon:yes gene_type:complete